MKTTKRRLGWPCIIVCMLCLLFACSNEENGEHSNSLVLKFEVAGNGVSRSNTSESGNTEAGWDGDWNENTVSCLYLLVFDQSGNLVKGGELALTEKVDDKSWNITSKFGITAYKASDYRFYLIANYGSTDFSKVSSLDDLKALSISGFSAYSSKQTAFLMDGNYAISDGNDTSKGYSNISQDNGTTTTTLTIKLHRALAKVCVRIYAKMPNDTKSQQITGSIPESMASTIKSISLGLVNYVSNSALIADGSPAITSTSLTYANTNESSAQAYDISSYGNTYTPAASDNKGTRFVFYSYANDWFNPNKADEMNTQEPIYKDRRTYVLLTVNGQDGTEYKYQIPVNYSLPSYNDTQYSSLTDAQKEELRSHYELQRNYVYNITASIIAQQDSEDNITYSIIINDWKNGKYATLTPED